MSKRVIQDKRANGRNNPCVLEGLNPQECNHLWSKLRHQVDLMPNDDQPVSCCSCYLWTGSKQNGYPALSQGHGKSKIKVHILAAWTKYHRLPKKSEVVSHLCHRKLCVNPEHLVIESIAENNARKGCLCSLVDTAGVTWSLCWHYPKCLRRDTAILGDLGPTIHEPNLVV